MNLKSTSAIALMFIGISTGVMTQECFADLAVERIVFDRQKNQAYVVMSDDMGKLINVWSDSTQEDGHLGVSDLNLPLLTQEQLKKMLDDMTYYGIKNMDGVDYAGPHMSRASVVSIEVARSAFNNANGSTLSYPMEINLKRGYALTETVVYEGEETLTPVDFAFDTFDIISLNAYWEKAEMALGEMQKLDLQNLSMCL